jgi:glyoxylate reductase
VTTTVVTADLPTGALDPLDDAGHDVVQVGDGDDLAEMIGSAEAVICVLTDRIDRRLLEAGARGRLRVVANVAVGYDNIDVDAASTSGIAVTNTPGILDESTADLAFALALMARRGTGAAERTLRAGQWGGWTVTDFLGHDVHGATLGVVGWGRIGRAVARRAAGFGMHILHTARRPTGEPGETTLADLFHASDVVSLHVPLTKDTRHLVDARRLASMKPTSVLVNTARGAVVDEEALARALHDGTIFGAGLDVFEGEPAVHPHLLTAPNAVLLPHIASATLATRTAMARMAAESVLAVLDGDRPSNLVTDPGTRP